MTDAVSDPLLPPANYRGDCYCTEYPTYVCEYHSAFADGWEQARDGSFGDPSWHALLEDRQAFEWLAERLGFAVAIGDVDPNDYIEDETTSAADAWRAAIRSWLATGAKQLARRSDTND